MILVTLGNIQSILIKHKRFNGTEYDQLYTDPITLKNTINEAQQLQFHYTAFSSAFQFYHF